jgi:hypothetical protein
VLAFYIFYNAKKYSDYITELFNRYLTRIKPNQRIKLQRLLLIFNTKPNDTVQFSFEYEQTDKQFVLLNKKYRYMGMILLCIWGLFVIQVFIGKLFMGITLYEIKFFLFTLGTPLIIILFLCSCHITITLNNNGLKRRFNSMFFSFTKCVPLHDLRGIRYKIGETITIKQVIAVTTYREFIVYDSKFARVTSSECIWLADLMQKLLFSLQEEQAKSPNEVLSQS